MPKYCLSVTSNSYDLCVFLNDGVAIDSPDTKFLLVEVNGPCEITTKVITAEESQSAKYKDYLPLDV